MMSGTLFRTFGLAMLALLASQFPALAHPTGDAPARPNDHQHYHCHQNQMCHSHNHDGAHH